ncbi:Uncharacterised protein [Salmonella enterica subsp. enterica serovar Bovismorbificans]|uniref:Uncharacterized protein n=1 Tax=Salmonella enterica subsp. enterica serovar Bovismorbificans TaxID=58097 RepID=A0A655CMD8_SALET|nr:Uncharacterised protein [Salmonella enterica subsp. enterica serovar Bovismorbificans]
MANFRRYQLAVAGENFHRNSARLQRFQRRRGGLFRRIEKSDIPFQNEVRLIDTLVIALTRRQVFGRDGDHA